MMGFPGGSNGKESVLFFTSARDLGLIPGLERYPGEGNGYPLQYSCLENPMDRGAWQTTNNWAINDCQAVLIIHVFMFIKL